MRQTRPSFWPALITEMIRDRQHAAQTQLTADRNELHNEDVRAVHTVDRVLQDLHDDFDAIRMIFCGQRTEFESMVRGVEQT